MPTVLAAFAARRFAAPLKLVVSRLRSFITQLPAAEPPRVRLGADRSGRMLAAHP